MMEQVQALLQQAAALRLAALALGPPRPGRDREMQALALEVSPHLRREAAALAGFDLAAADAAHHRLLGSSGAVSGCESAYPGVFSADKGTLLADISAFYQAFGFQPGEELPEPPDHIAVQLAYLAFLSIKEAFAHHRGDREKAEICARAFGDFNQAHLGRWGAALSERLAQRQDSELPLAGVRLALQILPPPVHENI